MGTVKRSLPHARGTLISPDKPGSIPNQDLLNELEGDPSLSGEIRSSACGKERLLSHITS